MTSEYHKPRRSQVNVSGDTKALIDALAERYRLTITEATALAVEHFSAMTNEEQLRAILDRTKQENAA
jgi:hypothetical protein